MPEAIDALDDESDPAPAPVSHERTLGRYRLCFELASGGMATVYLARAEGPGGYEKLVALKRIHPHLVKESHFIEMFLDEARLSARITHAHVAPVVDFGEAGGSYFLAMEYLAGETVGRLVRAVQATDDRTVRETWVAVACRIVADLCEGLHTAHELTDEQNRPLQVVHRDISPSNLLVTYDGIAYVMDFGVARARNRLHKTSTGLIKGKHGYMAPEMLGGGAFDRRADIWALGVVLWEMIAQRRLFRRRTEAESLFAVVSEPIHPPSAHARVPAAVDAVVMRALTRDPAARYPTARALGQDLMNAVGRPVGLAEVSGTMERLFREERARKRQLMDIARADNDGIVRLHAEQEEVSSDPTHASTIRASTTSARVRRARWPALVLGSVVIAGASAAIALFAAEWLRADEESAVAAREAEPAAGSRQAPAPPPAEPHSPDTRIEAEPETEAELEESAQVAMTERDDVADREGESAPVRYGWVNVATPGTRAAVFVRGRRHGETPTRVRLPEGTHAIELRPHGGGARARVRVRVTANATNALVHRF